jgi:hypothetical protein
LARDGGLQFRSVFVKGQHPYLQVLTIRWWIEPAHRRYNFRLDYASPRATTADADPAPSIFSALREQLGLRLKNEKASMDVLVIDRADREPLPN